MLREKLFKWLILYYKGKITKMALAKNLGLKVSELTKYLERLEKFVVKDIKRRKNELTKS